MMDVSQLALYSLYSALLLSRAKVVHYIGNRVPIGTQKMCLADLAACGECGKLGKGLLPGAANPHQQGVAAVHPDDAVHSCQVLQGVVKQNQFHLGLVLIVLLQDLLQSSDRGRSATRQRLETGQTVKL